VSATASDGGQPASLPVEAAPFKDRLVFLASKVALCLDGPKLGCLEPPAMPISAVTGEGVERLIERPASEARDRIRDREGVVITRERHRQELSVACQPLTAILRVTSPTSSCAWKTFAKRPRPFAGQGVGGRGGSVGQDFCRVLYRVITQATRGQAEGWAELIDAEMAEFGRS
jgi:hypothetical protein